MRQTLLSVVGVLAALAVPQPAVAGAPATFDRYLRDSFEATGLPGMAVVVTHGDDIVYEAGFGHDSTGHAITVNTPMRVASVSKSFTAATVMSLVDDGKVVLDRPVDAYLPEFDLEDPRARSVTVRQLLNQTSGFSDRTLPIAVTQRATDLAGYVAALRGGRLATDPGTRYEYCNVNYDVAARLVEAVDGRPFRDAVQARIFGPLGMSGSGVGGRPADGYNSIFGTWVSRAELPGFRSGGAGGVVTSANGMGRWLISQTGHGPRVLSAGSRATMQTPSALGGYAMGWGREGDLLVHSGNLFTYTAVEAIDPVTGYGYAVLTNSASLQDETYDVMSGLVALSKGQSPSAVGGGRQTWELGLGLATLVAAVLGVIGVVRARRWRGRRLSRSWWRLLPALVPVALLAAYPALVSLLMNGRAVTWAQMTYFAAPLTITLGVAALAGLVTTAARLRSVGSGR